MVACPKGCHMLVRTSINCHYLYLFVVGFQFWNNGGHIPFGSIWIILGFVWIGFVLVYFKFNMMKHWILTGFWGVTWTLCEPGEVGRFAEGTLGGGGCGSPTAEGGWKPWEGSRFGRTAAECALVDESIGKCIQSDEVWWGLMMSDVVGVAVYGCLWPFWGKVRLRDVLMVVAYFLIFEWEAEAASAATVDRRVCDWQISPLHVTRFLETLERLFQVAIPSCNCAHKTWPKTWPCARATCEATQQKMQSCLDLKRHFQAQTISWVDEVDFHLLDPFSIWKRQHMATSSWRFPNWETGRPQQKSTSHLHVCLDLMIWSRTPEVCEVRFASLLRRWSGFQDVWIPRKRKSDNLSSSSWKRTLCYTLLQRQIWRHPAFHPAQL